MDLTKSNMCRLCNFNLKQINDTINVAQVSMVNSKTIELRATDTHNLTNI